MYQMQQGVWGLHEVAGSVGDIPLLDEVRGVGRSEKIEEMTTEMMAAVLFGKQDQRCRAPQPGSWWCGWVQR